MILIGTKGPFRLIFHKLLITARTAIHVLSIVSIVILSASFYCGDVFISAWNLYHLEYLLGFFQGWLLPQYRHSLCRLPCLGHWHNWAHLGAAENVGVYDRA